MFVQLFSGWRYRPGVRESLAARGMGDAVRPMPTPDVPGLVARLLATDTTDEDTGIGVWVWVDEAACRAYEKNRSPEVNARLAAELEESAMIEQTFDVLAFGCRTSPSR
jgi:hypothetical protein